MKYTIEHDSNRGFYVIRVSEDLKRPDDSIALQKLAFDLRAENGCNRFLFDMSGANIIGGDIEAFRVGITPTETGLDRNFIVALVYSGNMEKHQFMENVLVNRGYQVRVFDDVHTAFEWLTPRIR